MTLKPLFPTSETLGINTDLYELTMAAAYYRSGHRDTRATFELFTRRLPQNRGFLLAAGLEQALHYILNVSFSAETLAYLQSLPNFRGVDPSFFEYLASFRFTGDVDAVPEGTIVFADEPLLSVTAPIIEAQILETFLINTLNFQTMVTSKASRLCLAARERPVLDFGTRRAHSPQAGVLAARAAFIGGCTGTSNVLAGFEMGIPVFGTMAHSFVQFFENELDAFSHYQATFPEHTILLVDTYDTIKGVKKALSLGGKTNALRLESGNLHDLAVEARRLLDQQGRSDIRLFASGNLDEEKIHAITLADTPIDAFGAGTDLVISSDAPSCDLVYKLAEVFENGLPKPKMKTSEGKMSTPFRKQVFRAEGAEGFTGDLIAKWDEPPPAAGSTRNIALLKPYIRAGRLCTELPTLQSIRQSAAAQLKLLPSPYKLLHTAQEYPVEFSRTLLQARDEFMKTLKKSR